MRTAGTFAALAAAASAQQFVLYAQGDDSYSQRADPIITPGKLSGHVHDFAGASAFKPELTTAELLESDCTTVGDKTPSNGGFAKDHSVYWHPALYAESSQGKGYVKIPTTLHKMYYRKIGGASKYAEPFEFPPDFRMVGGDPFRREQNSVPGITHWQCMGTADQGSEGLKLNGPCDEFSGLVAKVHFPHCWNGEAFNQDDPTAHMAYPQSGASFADCPSSHPITLPHIEFENLFAMHEEVYNTIKPDTLVLAQGDPTGYGMHGDFFNGWENGTIGGLINECPQDGWGNQDVGTCAGFVQNSTPRQDCKLTQFYKEEIENPGASLVGCNPISMNASPLKAVVAALKNTCGGEVDSGTGYESPSSSDDSSSAGPSISIPAYSAPAPVYSAPAPSTTFAVATSAAWAPAPSYAAPIEAASYEEEEDDDDDVVWMTEWVEATETATVYAKRDAHSHNHLAKHKRRHI